MLSFAYIKLLNTSPDKINKTCKFQVQNDIVNKNNLNIEQKTKAAWILKQQI